MRDVLTAKNVKTTGDNLRGDLE